MEDDSKITGSKTQVNRQKGKECIFMHMHTHMHTHTHMSHPRISLKHRRVRKAYLR